MFILKSMLQLLGGEGASPTGPNPHPKSTYSYISILILFFSLKLIFSDILNYARPFQDKMAIYITIPEFGKKSPPRCSVYLLQRLELLLENSSKLRKNK